MMVFAIFVVNVKLIFIITSENWMPDKNKANIISILNGEWFSFVDDISNISKQFWMPQIS